VEIFELLELGSEAKRPLIEERIREKHQYFSNLVGIAPTEALARIYRRNLDAIVEYARQNGYELAGAPAAAGKGRDLPQAPQAASRPTLRISAAGAAPETVPLGPGRNIIGRAPSLDGYPIEVDDRYMSKDHFVIEVGAFDGGFIAYDAGEVSGSHSTNGVFIGDSEQRVAGKVNVKPGSLLRAGDHSFEIVLSAPTAALRGSDAEGDFNLRTVYIKAPGG
jgi:hypothetical protein